MTWIAISLKTLGELGSCFGYVFQKHPAQYARAPGKYVKWINEANWSHKSLDCGQITNKIDVRHNFIPSLSVSGILHAMSSSLGFLQTKVFMYKRWAPSVPVKYPTWLHWFCLDQNGKEHFRCYHKYNNSSRDIHIQGNTLKSSWITQIIFFISLKLSGYKSKEDYDHLG